jgi:Archaeal DNA polymerase II, small subunit/DNA polymerase delta, subunit B
MMEDTSWNSTDSCCLIVFQASVYQTLHGVPNPYECEIGGRRMLGTSGQPVFDIACYSKLSDPLHILQHTLEWAHIAPTCPDTLSELVLFHWSYVYNSGSLIGCNINFCSKL